MGCGGRVIPLTTCCFFLNNFEMHKAVTLAFCSTNYLFITDILAKFCIPNLPQSADIGQTPDRGIFDFQISGQSFINENCDNSITGHDTDIKLGPVTKPNRRYMPMLKTMTMTLFQEILMSLSLFPIYGQFTAIRKPHSWGMVYKSYIFINNDL